MIKLNVKTLWPLLTTEKCHFIRNWSKSTGGVGGGPEQREMWWTPTRKEDTVA